jgi:hypothetical protein
VWANQSGASGRLSLRLGRGDQAVVDLTGAHRGRAVEQPVPIGGEGRALVDGAELHAPADLRAGVDVGRREAVAGQVLATRDRRFKGVQGVGKVAEPSRALLLGLGLEAQAAGGDRGLHRARAEEQPAIVGTGGARPACGKASAR